MGEILALAHAATQPGWWLDFRHDIVQGLGDYIAYEDGAQHIRIYQNFVLPGLLQTRAYAHHVIHSISAISPDSPRVTERRVEARMRRQDVLSRRPPLELSAMIDESALMRGIGGADVMKEQLERLVELMRLPNVTIGLIPLETAGEPIMVESFTLMSFSAAYDAELPDVLFLESISATEFRDDSTTHLYRLAWESLATAALTPDESLDRVLRIARDRWGR
ncbi:DUF5753 domain-containing protein [Actinomadura rubrisoli]|uniref:XRE family transcriptional regulator n=1 Tax=Actinomadura rubrisoli TaxID=2530368 RepID=A0A4R4ZPA2_9ACTN|nr:DUF5753 domain-containing protein [Actinomadura rubrisoli]TDD60505.1 XRE family transcriptional regulator [Actinomadura rubrisoli]